MSKRSEVSAKFAEAAAFENPLVEGLRFFGRQRSNEQFHSFLRQRPFAVTGFVGEGGFRRAVQKHCSLHMCVWRFFGEPIITHLWGACTLARLGQPLSNGASELVLEEHSLVVFCLNEGIPQRKAHGGRLGHFQPGHRCLNEAFLGCLFGGGGWLKPTTSIPSSPKKKEKNLPGRRRGFFSPWTPSLSKNPWPHDPSA